MAAWLVGNMLTLYPEFFGAAVCQVPLLDMRNYTHWAAGASWIAEYGDPDKPDDWTFLKTFSPYDNLSSSRSYPPVLLFTTSTRDDRVGPVHARKMTAKLSRCWGRRPVAMKTWKAVTAPRRTTTKRPS